MEQDPIKDNDDLRKLLNENFTQTQKEFEKQLDTSNFTKQKTNSNRIREMGKIRKEKQVPHKLTQTKLIAFKQHVLTSVRRKSFLWKIV